MLEHDKHELEPSKGQFLVTDNGTLKLDVRFEDESVWLTQQLMAVTIYVDRVSPQLTQLYLFQKATESMVRVLAQLLREQLRKFFDGPATMGETHQPRIIPAIPECQLDTAQKG